MLHAESSENCGNIHSETETYSGIIAVDFDDEEFACRAEVCDFVLL